MLLVASALSLVAAPPATAAPAGVYVAAVAESTLNTVVIDAAGRAYASNGRQARVEVLNLGTGALEAPITVGATPMGLDLSPDGTKLYVANSGTTYLSVIDLALRREVRRIDVPGGASPYWIAVGNDGTALVSTLAGTSTARLYRLTVTETFEPLADSPFLRPLRANADRSRIAVAAPLSIYTVATRAFTTEQSPLAGLSPFPSVDNTGSTVMASGGGAETIVLNGDLSLRWTVATAPGGAVVVLNGAGTAGYGLMDTWIDVLDPRKGLLVGKIPFPAETYRRGGVALSPDERTVVALTNTGFLVAPVGSAVPVACPPRSTGALVTMCGAPLADVVMDGAGRAYATNPARNQVEVVSLATGTLEAPILVGSRPEGLDLSPDGTTLYVANHGGYDVSVVDVAQRREVRRIAVPPDNPGDRPYAVAAPANGTLLVTTGGDSTTGRVLQGDPAGGTLRLRRDNGSFGATLSNTRMKASGDRSRIGIAQWSSGDFTIYESATDSFTVGDTVGEPSRFIALDHDGSRILLGPGGHLVDRDLVLRATIPGPGIGGVAVNASGSTGYRVQASSIDVLDLGRGLKTASIPLPAPVGSAPGVVALSSDGSTLALLTDAGLAIARTSAAVPVPACVPSTAPAGVVAVCGAPLAEAVVDGQGRLYATNPSRNQVEVVSLATKTLEAPILVGSQPRGLDLSVDGKTLYVANTGGRDVSVVDLTQRREVRRMVMPSDAHSRTARPFSIAVAADGTAFMSTIGGTPTGPLRVIDLADGTVRSYPREVLQPARLQASADRSRVAAVTHSAYGRETLVYDTRNGEWGTSKDLRAIEVALDGSGATILVSPTGAVLDSQLALKGQLPYGVEGVALNAAGTVGYSIVTGTKAVDVLDMVGNKVARSLPLPEVRRQGLGGTALTADGATLAVLTQSGVAVVGVGGIPAVAPYSVWTQPNTSQLDATGGWVATVNDPVAGPGQLPAQYLYGQYFSFAAGGAIGVVGLTTDPAGKFAMVNVVEANGTQHLAAVPFDWKADRLYFPLVKQIGPGTLGAWVYDYTAGTWTAIGVLQLPSAWGRLAPGRLTAVVWYGPVAADCSVYPKADVFFAPPSGFFGTTAAYAAPVSSGTAPAGACPATTAVVDGFWARATVGASR